MRATRFLVIPFATCAWLGCERELPPGEFVAAYEASQTASVEMSGYRFTALLQNQDYLNAKSSLEELGKVDAIKSGPQVILRIASATPPGDIPDISKDPLYSSLSSGENAFQERLRLFQFGFAQYAELDYGHGEKVAAVASRYSRNPIANGYASFLFQFPIRKNKNSPKDEQLQLVIRDFGLATGTLRIPLKAITELKLKG